MAWLLEHVYVAGTMSRPWSRSVMTGPPGARKVGNHQSREAGLTAQVHLLTAQGGSGGGSGDGAGAAPLGAVGTLDLQMAR